MTIIKHLNSSSVDFEKSLESVISSTSEPSKSVIETVSKIIADVRERGDDALLEYTNLYDHRSTQIESLQIEEDDIKIAFDRVSDSMRRSLAEASRRIRTFHEKQKQETWIYKDDDGNELGQRITSLDRVGVYVPGGKAAYPSSVLMNVIPAQVAGVKEIIMVVPTPEGERSDLVLAAAEILGVP